MAVVVLEVVAVAAVASNYTISFNYLCENEKFSVFVDWLVCMNYKFVAEKQKSHTHTFKVNASAENERSKTVEISRTFVISVACCKNQSNFNSLTFFPE